MAIYDDVVKRLLTLGYAVTENPDEAVIHSIERAALKIKTETGRQEIPKELYGVHADMASGLFLQEKKALGALGEDFDFSASVQSITEGKISVSFAGEGESGTPEAQFDRMAERLASPPPHLFAAYRRIAW